MIERGIERKPRTKECKGIERGKETRQHMELKYAPKYPYQVYYVQVSIQQVEGFSEDEYRDMRGAIYQKAQEELRAAYPDEPFAIYYPGDVLENGVQEFYIACSVIMDEKQLVNIMQKAVNRHATVINARGKKLLSCFSYEHSKFIVDTVYTANDQFGSTTIH